MFFFRYNTRVWSENQKLLIIGDKEKIIQTPFPPSIMSRNRFQSILSNLHLNDNRTYVKKGEPNHDPLHKIRPYFDYIKSKFAESVIPSREITVDEGICGFRGRIHFRVYIKNKPDKYGIKLFIACEATSGYALNIEVYTGKGAQSNSIIPLFQRLLQKYLGKGYTIYMDRFYSSPQVFDFLWNEKTLAVGTCMSNRRELPKQNLINKKLKKGEMAYMRRNHLLCLKWKDTRDVVALSTCHQATSSNVVVRGRTGAVTKNKPDVILDYNRNKTGVDKNDQLVAYYPFKRKQLKWWKKLFFHLFLMSITNAYQLYCKTRSPNEVKAPLLDFMIQIGEALAEKGGVELQNHSQQIASNRLLGRHFPERVPATDKKKHPTRTCKVCSDRFKAQTGGHQRKESTWWCPDCEVGLCLPDCFKVYHTVAKYY